jgi:hypothetical protein
MHHKEGRGQAESHKGGLGWRSTWEGGGCHGVRMYRTARTHCAGLCHVYAGLSTPFPYGSPCAGGAQVQCSAVLEDAVQFWLRCACHLGPQGVSHLLC